MDRWVGGWVTKKLILERFPFVRVGWPDLSVRKTECFNLKDTF